MLRDVHTLKLWKAVLKSKEIVLENERWVIGDGQSLRAFDDHWVPGVGILRPLLNGVPDTTIDAALQSTVRVADLIYTSQSGRQWNQALLNSLWPPHIVHAILALPLGHRDIRCWLTEPAGSCS